MNARMAAGTASQSCVADILPNAPTASIADGRGRAEALVGRLPGGSWLRRAGRAFAGEVPARYWALLAALFAGGYVYYHATHRGMTGDGLYYAAMTMMRAGHPYWDALHQVGVYFHDPHIFRLDFGFFDPGFNPLIKPRVMYPILSAPFVWAFGVGGMWAVPVLAAVYTLWGNTRLIARLYSPRIAMAVVLPFMTTIAWWEFGTGVYTEPLAIAFMTCLLRNLPIGQVVRLRAHCVVGLMLVALSLTRQMTVVPMAMLVAPYLYSVVRTRRLRTEWLAPAAVGVLVGGLALLLLMVWAPYDAVDGFLRNTHSKTLDVAVRHLPGIAWRLLRAESASYLRADLPMVALWVAAIVSCVARWRGYIAALFLGAAGSSLVFAVLNGVAGSLRYFFPMYPVLLLMVAEGMRCFFATQERNPARAGSATVSDKRRSAPG